MRTFILCIAALILASQAFAADLLIIQSQETPQMNQAVAMLQESCAVKSSRYILANYAEFDLARIVREEQPRIVLSIGDASLRESIKLHNTSVLYSLSLSENEINRRRSSSGITVHAAPHHYIKIFKTLELKKVGIIYSNAKSGRYLERARAAAAQSGIRLVTVEITSPREVPAALEELSSSVEAIWMIPDTTAVTSETINSYFTSAQKNRIPIISFAKEHTDKGALLALVASRTSMVKQLCTMVQSGIKGTSPSDIPVEDIKDGILVTNKTVAERLDIPLATIERLYSSKR